MAENLLFYGDNLDVLRRQIADQSVDLVSLTPLSNQIKTTMPYLPNRTKLDYKRTR
jgi:hypothetical protein